MYKKSF